MVNFLRPHIRSDNAPEFTAKAVREWLELVGVKTLFIEPGMRKRVDFLLFYRHVFMSQKCNAQINKVVNRRGLYEWLGCLRSGYLIKNSKITNFFKWIEQIAALGITCGRKMSVHWGCVKLNIFVNFSEVEGVIYF